MNRSELASILDDFAAVADQEGCRSFAASLPSGSPARRAALRRSWAIRARLSGDVMDALEFEALSERCLARVPQ